MKKLLLLLVFFWSIHVNIYSQNHNKKLFYSSFDNTVGLSNTLLSYGTLFKEKYIKRFKNNHNFFLNNKFNKGDIHYKGEPFFDVHLKYDIVDDFVVLKILNQKQNISIKPNKSLIKTFQIGNFKFVNTKLGFLEELYVLKNFSIYKKHQKVSKENLDKLYKKYTFKEKEPQFILFYKGEYYSIKSKRDFIKIFPSKKKNIIKHYRSNKLLAKKDFKHFVIILMKQLQELT
ncbi:hypothetical protein H3Z83_01950 [Tenacibaculum sp. S7007]|uniref:Uncharacterized protein n=1 Tax=Tenacibaculum pelagium TaxID=2759527 RepID=A0A839ANJ0_9FLAO|nr:hypothetical protein [Tenacibaculum pelagium]MBA6155291.1 hypothetical protein [Tenacibaculum pelagium]